MSLPVFSPSASAIPIPLRDPVAPPSHLAGSAQHAARDTDRTRSRDKRGMTIGLARKRAAHPGRQPDPFGRLSGVERDAPPTRSDRRWAGRAPWLLVLLVAAVLLLGCAALALVAWQSG